MTAAPRVLLLVPARTYRAADFLIAAGRMHLDLVVASDVGQERVVKHKTAVSTDVRQNEEN